MPSRLGTARHAPVSTARHALASIVFALLACAPLAAQEKYALLIGINEYRTAEVPALLFAEADAVALDSVLRQLGYEVTLLDNRRASREDILLELTWLRRNLTPEDELIVFFAGHGVRDTETTNNETYWLTFDAELDALDIEGIRLRHLMDFIQEIPSGRKLVLLDHCFSGDLVIPPPVGGRGSRVARSDTVEARAERRGVLPVQQLTAQLEAPAEGLVLLAGARDEAYETPDLGHGVFTNALLSALTTDAADTDQDGRIDVEEIASYVRAEVPQALANLPGLSGVSQEVVYRSNATNFSLSDWELGAIRAPGDPEFVSALVSRYDETTHGEYDATLWRWMQEGWISSQTRMRCWVALKRWKEAFEAAAPAELRLEDGRIVSLVEGAIGAGAEATPAEQEEYAAALEDGLQQLSGGG